MIVTAVFVGNKVRYTVTADTIATTQTASNRSHLDNTMVLLRVQAQR
ncbi:hypothetical protein [Corynebacterium pseudotuberculosis]|nr:hypothetical protein [Corynebacterium pseudotuberculosis]WFP68294.1 hypothetical protein P8128_01045 [Corynebacterium pseudotuberculosis]